MKQQDSKKMRAIYEQWLISGQSKSFFSNKCGLRLSTFNYWIKKFQTINELPSNNSRGFSQLAIQDNISVGSSKAAAIINFPSGIRVELCFPVSALYLKELVE